LTVLLLAATVAGYALFSHAPAGGEFKSELYQVTEHHRLASRVLEAIPSDAKVATQDPYVPHLSHREHIYLYPWIRIGLDNMDYVLLDRNLHPYPLQPHEMNEHIDNLLADVSYSVDLEADGIYLFRRVDDLGDAFKVGATVGETMYLDRVEVAVRGEDGLLRAASRKPVQLCQGEMVRIGLYWEALDAPGAERTVSVRVSDPSGAVVAIHDNMPGMGKKPTSWWQKGWQIRDTYYLTIPPTSQPGPGSLSVLVYDSYSQEIVLFDGHIDLLEILSIQIVP
jgi:hypothetical protein